MVYGTVSTLSMSIKSEKGHQMQSTGVYVHGYETTGRKRMPLIDQLSACCCHLFQIADF